MKSFLIFAILILFSSICPAVEIVGEVLSKSACAPTAEIWISKAKVLYYQLSVPVGGSFQVNLVARNYDIVAGDKNGCTTNQKINVDTIEKKIKLVLSDLKDRKPAQAFCEVCFDLQMQAQTQNASMQSYYPFYDSSSGYGGAPTSPWWGMYNQMSYSNYASPCVWQGYGCGGGNYPGHGGGMVGKPNVYIRDYPENSDVEVELVPTHETTVLATVPKLDKFKWKGKFKKEFTQGSVQFPYLFHDLRVDTTQMQFNSGFCEDRENLMNSLTSKMKTMGFSECELHDFQAYWSLKMPSAASYCVYPQTNEQMDRVARLEVKPKPTRIVRVNFFIIPTAELPEKLKNLRTPASVWAPPKSPQTIDRTVYEWGIGFLAVE